MRLPAFACALAFASGCAAHVPPRIAPTVALDEEEQRMWRVSAELEERLDRTDAIVRDAALEAYVLEVARRLHAPEVFAAIPFRVRVLQDAEPNAFCLPNGAIYLHTGILALLESEAELAVLLAHEMTHATHRHALRHVRSTNRAGMWFSSASGASGARLLQVVSSGYSRDLEREADSEGLARVTAAGYDAADGVSMLERLRDWEADELVRKRTASHASHPQLEERIESCRAALKERGARGGERKAETYAERTAGVLLLNARLDLAAGRYGGARRGVERYLALRARDARGQALLGDILRRQGSPGFEQPALAAYRRAVELEPATADAWRGIGLVLQRSEARDEARAAFTRYLELAPHAPDAAHVRATLEETSGGRP